MTRNPTSPPLHDEGAGKGDEKMTEAEIRKDERAKCVDRLTARHALEGLEERMRSHYASILDPDQQHAPAWTGPQPVVDGTTNE
jgi:hypothetical protein